jgi:hypothetical protein
MATLSALPGGAVTRVGTGVALVLAIPAVAMLFTDQVAWTWTDFLAAGVLLATIGTVLELAVRRAGNPAASIGVAVLGVAAAVLGRAGDAPGLVLLGLLLFLSGCALGVRLAHHRR